MSGLPEHRRIVHGRTHSRAWRASDYNPIEHHGASISERVADALLATALGLIGAAIFVHFLSR